MGELAQNKRCRVVDGNRQVPIGGETVSTLLVGRTPTNLVGSFAADILSSGRVLLLPVNRIEVDRKGQNGG